MNTITRWVGKRLSGDGTDEETPEDTETAPRNESLSSLFHCPDCSAVYIAIEKSTCSACDTAVERVRSTFTEPE